MSLSFVLVTPGASTCNLTGGQVICNLGALAVGASTQVTIQVMVATTERGPLTNMATVTANEPRSSTPKSAALLTLINPMQIHLRLVAR